MRSLLGTYVLALAMICFSAQADQTKKLIDTINVCNRNDPELSKCLCTNVQDVIPQLKGGVPQMSIMPIDPFMLANVKMNLSNSQRVRITANLQNMTIRGISGGQLQNCAAYQISDGIQLYIELRFPRLELKSLYKGVGRFLFMSINATGDFHAEITGAKAKTVWNSTRYSKDDTEYLIYIGDIINLTMDKVAIYFNNVFGNNTDLNDNINNAINENIDLLYNDVKPVILETIRGVFQKVINDFHATFPMDVLYRNE